MNKKKKLSIIFNVLIFVFVLFGSIMAFGKITVIPVSSDSGNILKYFTVQSNILAGIVALLYVIFYIKNKDKDIKVPFFVFVLKYIATIDLLITFLVVALFLGFITPDGYISVYYNANFFFHLIVPILNIISFIFFEPFYIVKKIQTLFGVIHLFIYSIFYQIVAISHFENGKVDIKYDWYAFAQKGVPIAIFFAVIILFIGYLVAYFLFLIKNCFHKHLF